MSGSKPSLESRPAGVDQCVISEDIELSNLLEAIYRRYSYDFRAYSRDSVARRVQYRLSMSQIASISELQYRILHDESLADLLLKDLSVNVTEMFRDPDFFLALRTKVLHFMKEDHIRIWDAGCSSGEEAYSVAIILNELGIHPRQQILATDFNSSILDKAKQGIFPLGRMSSYIKNYLAAGGEDEFSEYYNSAYDGAIIKRKLKDYVHFAYHNLATDAGFHDMDLVICRNVVIYFDRDLHERVFGLFYESLRDGGYLCLGSEEGLIGSKYDDYFDVVDKKYRIYQKKAGKSSTVSGSANKLTSKRCSAP
ncbi:MAG: chemotaxis protein CheR [Alteromonadaceae bacterium]|nr:MAG: chemotaxis protein CheR [Alteromonadaceae bacterium]